jgi:nickel-dependent lactate racemase
MTLLPGVASQSALCYEFVTVLSWFAARLIPVTETGPERRSTSKDTETAQKNFVRFSLENQHRKILTARGSAFGVEDEKKPS